MKEYTIKSGDNFYLLAQQMGCCWQDFIDVNPAMDPCCLQIGQRVKLPLVVQKKQTFGGCSEALKQGSPVKRCDDVFVEVEGVKFRVTRIGEPSVPHEVHLILPRTEIRKVEHPMNGIIETSIMLSNINIVNSPRFEGEGSDRAEQGRSQIQIQNQRQNQNQSQSQSFNQNPSYNLGEDQYQTNYGNY